MLGIGNSALLGMQITTTVSKRIAKHINTTLIYMYQRNGPTMFISSHSNNAMLHSDAMKLVAQKNEYHWLPLSMCEATFR